MWLLECAGADIVRESIDRTAGFRLSDDKACAPVCGFQFLGKAAIQTGETHPLEVLLLFQEPHHSYTQVHHPAEAVEALDSVPE
jgi:hypothetical protein